MGETKQVTYGCQGKNVLNPPLKPPPQSADFFRRTSEYTGPPIGSPSSNLLAYDSDGVVGLHGTDLFQRVGMSDRSLFGTSRGRRLQAHAGPGSR